MTGREVVIVEAVRSPIGRGHPEKGYYRDTHATELLGRTYQLITTCLCQSGCPSCVGPEGHTGPHAKTVASQILLALLPAEAA